MYYILYCTILYCIYGMHVQQAFLAFAAIVWRRQCWAALRHRVGLDGEAFTAAMATIRDDPALPRLAAACDSIVEQLRAAAAAAVRQPTAYLPQLWDQVPHGRGRALAAQ